MKSITKKLLAIIITVCVLLSVMAVNTFAAGSSIAFSNSKPTIGETVTVTGRISAPEQMVAVEGYMTYDPKIVEFVSGDNCNILTNGKLKIVVDVSAVNSITQTVKFKAIAAGKATIALESLKYVNMSDSEQTLTGSSAALTVTNPSAQASSDATLRNLSVSSGTLTPKFHPEVTSYNVTIENSVTELWLQATKTDPKQTYTVEGSKDMKVGFNKRVVTVTAENGNTKTYTVNIIRLDENGNPPSEETVDTPVNDAIEVDINGVTMYISEDFSTQSQPKNFNVIDYAFDGHTIPALSDNKYVMIYLTMPDGSDSGFYVVNRDGSFTKLVTIDLYADAPFYVLPTDKVPDGYRAVDGCEIGGLPVPAYKSSEDSASDFFLVFAKGPGGQNTFYKFDTVDQTLQRATDLTFGEDKKEDDSSKDDDTTESGNIIDSFNELNVNGKIVVITIPAIMILLIAAIIVLIVKIATAGKGKDDYMDDEEETGDDAIGFDFITTSESESAPQTDASADASEENAEEEEVTEQTEEEIPEETAEEESSEGDEE